jgi:hypothetical protein
MVLLALEYFSPPLIPELPENQARISNKNEPITSQVRAGFEKKLSQSPQARMVRASWTMTLTVEMMMIRTLTNPPNYRNNSRKRTQRTERKGALGGEPL